LLRKQRHQHLPALVARVEDLCLAVQSQDQGLLVEGTEHDCHATVLNDMRSGFIAAPRQVQPDDRGIVDDTKAVHPLGRYIDATPGAGGAHKIHVLFFNECTVRFF